MPKIRVSADLKYDVQTPSNFMFQIAAATSAGQTVESETLSIGGQSQPPEQVIPPYGMRAHVFEAQPGPLEVHYSADVVTNPQRMDTPGKVLPMDELPAEAIPFTYPSRYCESDVLAPAAADEFAAVMGDDLRVAAVADWVASRLDYVPGTTTAVTTAADVYLSREGVCRDYAHLATALTRALGVPVRYTAGYVVDLQPPDFHAVIEAYVGGHWHLYDATRLAPLEGFVRIGSGRDAADVSFASFSGQAVMTEMSVDAKFLDDTKTDPSDLTPLSLDW